MISKPLESIVEEDLAKLIEAGDPEGKQLEYKRALPEASDAGKVKFLRSVTSLANTQGGDVIYGMEAKDGIPQRIHPLEMASADQVLLRLESLCADGVSPRLQGVQFRFVPLASGGEVLVVRTSKSWNAPHRVSTGGHAHFYGRNANGSYQLDVGELRQAFTLSQTVAERIRAFRADRLLMLGSGDVPIPLADGARVVLHILPLQGMTSDVSINIRGNSQTLLKIHPPGAAGWHLRYNLDGRLTFQDDGHGNARGYAQLFRSGIVECVVTYKGEGSEPQVVPVYYEDELREAASNYLQALKELGLTPPVYIFLSCLGVAGYRLGVNVWRDRIEGRKFADRDALVIPEVMVEDWPDDVAGALRPAFDVLWNAFGYERSLNYDQNGRWAPH